MSTSETAPLNGRSRVEYEDSERNSLDDDLRDILEVDASKKKRDPLSILILYGLSFLVSAGGLIAAIWGYYIVVTAPFDEYSKKRQRDGYERYFWGMQSIVILLSINILWSGFNFHLARKAKQNEVWPLNMPYDFLLWATLIAFGVLNMVEMLVDRRMCDGWQDKEIYKKCDIAMFRLLVVEMVAVNLGLLVAVLHFILLVGRCCTQGRRNDSERSLQLRRRIREEEGLLVELMQRRRQLIEENEELEARRLTAQRQLPPLPAEADHFGDYHENTGQEDHQEEEDLIDVVADERTSTA